MIPDAERKVITILSNFSTMNKRMPSWQDLERKTGRRQEDLLKAINELQNRLLIRWNGVDTESIVIEPGWRYLL